MILVNHTLGSLGDGHSVELDRPALFDTTTNKKEIKVLLLIKISSVSSSPTVSLKIKKLLTARTWRYYVKVIDKHKVQLSTSFEGRCCCCGCTSDCGSLITTFMHHSTKSYNQNDVSYIALPVSAIAVNTDGKKLTMKLSHIICILFHKYYNYWPLHCTTNHNESYLY